MPILHYITWFYITSHQGTCLDCQILAYVGRTYINTLAEHLHHYGYKECHPHSTIDRSSTVPHLLVWFQVSSFSHKSGSALKDSYAKTSIHLARWLLKTAPADFMPNKPLTLNAYFFEYLTQSGPHLFCN